MAPPPPPGDRAYGKIKLPSVHSETEETPPSDNVRHMIIHEQKARVELSAQVEALGLQMVEFGRVMNDFKRHLNKGKWWRSIVSSAAFATVFSAVLGLIGVIYVAKTQKEPVVQAAKTELEIEAQHQRDIAAVISGVSYQLTELRTELEQQRRGYPQPISRESEVLTPKKPR